MTYQCSGDTGVSEDEGEIVYLVYCVNCDTIVAVSGIVGGRALKGPADRMLVSLGHDASALGVARLYAPWVDTFVVDRLDEALAPEIEALGLCAVVTDTIMTDDAARARLAGEMLEQAGV